MLIMSSSLEIDLADDIATAVIRNAIDEDKECFMNSELWMVQGGCVECPEYVEQTMNAFLKALVIMHRVGVRGEIQLADSDGCLMHYAKVHSTGVVLMTKDARWET